MLALTGCFVAVLYLTGLRADRSGTVASGIPTVGATSDAGLYRNHSAAFWAWKFRQRTRQLHKERAAHRAVWRPTVQYALRLASAAFGVPYWELHRVADCESHLYPFARNGQYRGLFQEGPMFERHPISGAGFNVYDPLPNALVAASTVAREGWSQWECRP